MDTNTPILTQLRQYSELHTAMLAAFSDYLTLNKVIVGVSNNRIKTYGEFQFESHYCTHAYTLIALCRPIRVFAAFYNTDTWFMAVKQLDNT